MRRTTIMADDALLDRLSTIARREGVSLAAVIRQGLEMRANQVRPRPSCIGAIDDPTIDPELARKSGDIAFEPLSWR